MIRSELVHKLVDENPHLHQRDVEKIVSTIFEEIINTMAEGDRVELRGFGALFREKARPAYWPQSADGRVCMPLKKSMCRFSRQASF